MLGCLSRVAAVLVACGVIGGLVWVASYDGPTLSDPFKTIAAEVGGSFTVVLERHVGLTWTLVTETDRVTLVKSDWRSEAEYRKFKAHKAGNVFLEFALAVPDQAIYPGDERIMFSVDVR